MHKYLLIFIFFFSATCSFKLSKAGLVVDASNKISVLNECDASKDTHNNSSGAHSDIEEDGSDEDGITTSGHNSGIIFFALSYHSPDNQNSDILFHPEAFIPPPRLS